MALKRKIAVGLGVLATLAALHYAPEARAQDNRYPRHAQHLTPEQRSGFYITDLAKEHGLTSTTGWNALDFERKELEEMQKNETDSLRRDTLARQIRFHDELEKRKFFEGYNKDFFKLEERLRDSLETWKKQFTRKTGKKIDDSTMRSLLQKSPQAMQTEIDYLEELRRKGKLDKIAREMLELRKKIHANEVDNLHNQYLFHPKVEPAREEKSSGIKI